MTKARPCEVPAFSALRSSLPTAYFHDCYGLALPPDDRSPLELYLSVVSQMPPWIDGLMKVRNKIVAQWGLKDVGPLSGIDPSKPSHAYRVGDQAGIFKLLELHEHEAVLGEVDRHLDVKLSVAKQNSPGGCIVSVSTVVHVHNTMGRVYMFFVTPVHRIVAPSTISSILPRTI